MPSVRQLFSESPVGTLLLIAGALGIVAAVPYGAYLVVLTGLSSASAGPTPGSISDPWMGPVTVLLAGFVLVGLSALFF